MVIDLNKPGALTLEAVVELLRSKDDSQNRQVRVSNTGIVYLSDDVGNQNLNDVVCRFETFCALNQYTGNTVKSSQDHVNWIYEELKRWPNMKLSYIDF